MNRKVFIQQMGAAALLTSLGVSLQSCSEEEEIEPSVNTPTTPGNNAKTVSFSLTSNDFSILNNNDAWLLHPDENILIVNIGGTISAFSSACPHSGCTRDWEEADDKLRCKCHGSEFNKDGSLVRGPATSGLNKLSVTVEDNDVTITI